MVDDEELRAKFAKVEALFRGAGSPGERAAGGTAMGRLQGRLSGPEGDREPEAELQFTLPDTWSVSLFVAVCRKHGVRPYRYARQRRTTITVRARKRAFHRVVWPGFSRLQNEIEIYFHDVTDHLITHAMGSDGEN